MSDQAAAPGSAGGEPGGDSDTVGDAQEAAMMRDVMRAQERHREGGVEHWLDDADADPEPDA
jgi:hypothetical protein